MYKKLHDSVPDSLKLGKLSDFAFRCWTIALSQVDWYGRLTAEPEKFVVKCFPNRREVTSEQVKAALDELAEVMGEGLIHLYRTSEGQQYLVFHKHQEHNPPSTHPRTKSECPPPPKGLCACVRYARQEGDGPFGGREFRFFPGLFDKEGREEERKQPAGNVQEGADAAPSVLGCADLCLPVLACASLCLSVQGKDVSSPLLSSSSPLREERGGVGGDGVAILAAEFSALTGKKAWRSEKERLQITETMTKALETRGNEALLVLMRERIFRERKRGRKLPVSLSYFGPIFSDASCFPSKSPTPAPAETRSKALTPADDYVRARADAEARLAELAEDERSAWTAQAEAEAEKAAVLNTYRPIYVKAKLVDRAMQTFGIAVGGKG
jgi:muramidase (phage lysozyme)